VIMNGVPHSKFREHTLESTADVQYQAPAGIAECTGWSKNYVQDLNCTSDNSYLVTSRVPVFV